MIDVAAEPATIPLVPKPKAPTITGNARGAATAIAKQEAPAAMAIFVPRERPVLEEAGTVSI